MVAVSAAVAVRRSPVSSVALARAAASSPAPSLLDAPAPAATMVQVDPDEEIIAQGDPAEYCYQVVDGCVRTVTLLDDGRRQIGQFLLPGDFFGWDAAGEHSFAAEAVSPTTLRRFGLATIEERAATDQGFARNLRHYIVGQVRQARDHMVLLGRKTAAERIASFLLEMHARLGRPADPAIALPMSRGDIADYLGLTIETVCRGLTEMRRQGVIEVERARIVIRDPRALGRGALAREGADLLH
jgi:CRP-like cAMP-binding protein